MSAAHIKMQPTTFLAVSFSFKKSHDKITLTSSTPVLSKVYNTVTLPTMAISRTIKLTAHAETKAQEAK